MHIAREHITRPGAPAPAPLRDVDPGDGVKPRGLWYGVNGDWRRWCESEMPEWVEGGTVYTVDISAARVLTIDDVDALDRLHDRYRVPSFPGARAADVIDWRRLAAEWWDGLEIAPYQWERRLTPGYLWYYGWDCASGVVWNASKARLTTPSMEATAAWAAGRIKGR